MNAEKYMEILTRFMKPLRRVRPQYAQQGPCCFVNENARPHTTNIVKQFLAKRDRHPIHLHGLLSDVGLPGNEVVDDLERAADRNPVDQKDHMVLTSTKIYSRAK
ncbi:hypothetical protein TNCV_826011 [Trichonephila clavipes]|nr:hypothetical protein TNCV_826011 [Trichonephila clavipes]